VTTIGCYYYLVDGNFESKFDGNLDGNPEGFCWILT